jgi:N-acetylgalactosamine kinase
MTTASSVIAETFRAAFSGPPVFVVRAPGRVNLLGEHTDYNALPVLPMAIERRVVIAGAPRDDAVVVLHNTASFPTRRYTLERNVAPFEAGDWGNYNKAAAQGLADYYDAPLARGADLLVDGDIPTGAGLSSSSALVVASALALLAANEREIPFATLAEILPPAERYVGTLSGGMDQAISLLARAGHALRIDFAPLRHRPVPLPEGHSVVVCHSLVQAEKSGAAKRGYNLRVIECRLACRVVEKTLDGEIHRPLNVLGELKQLFPRRALASFIADVARLIPDAPLDLAQVATAVGVSADELSATCEVPADQAGPFAVLRRVRHVLTEADRVDRAEETLNAGDAAQFGKLMDASHASCRDDYDISCPELEDLVALAKQAGALGARLTGAGFGGCTVNLVADTKLSAFLEQIDRRFYRPRLDRDADPNDVRFVFTPQPGASTARL